MLSHLVASEGENPVGQYVSFDSGATWAAVVGVVANVRQQLDRDPVDELYTPLRRGGPLSASVIARTTADPAAMTRSLRHEGEWWPWVLTGVVGTSVAYERVEAGRHFYTDVLVGAAIGTTLGILIPKWHHDQKFKDQTIGFMPIAGGAAALWRFNF